MTTTIAVNIVRNVVAPEGADTYDLSAATRIVPIAGRPKRLIQRLTATLSHPLQDVIGAALMDLIDAGVYDRLDLLALPLANAADSLLNWQTNGRVATNTGMTWAKGTGFAGDGAAAWINPNWALGKYQLDNAPSLPGSHRAAHSRPRPRRGSWRAGRGADRTTPISTPAPI